MGQAEISCDVTDLHRLGGALAGIGLPWVLTIFAMSGFWTDDVSIVPLLWFAPPFLLKRLLVAARLELPRRVVWWSALVAGASSWVVAVGASLSGARAVMNVAHSVGVAAGAVLFCVALLSLTDSLGWDAHVVRWRSALRTWLFSVAASVVGAALWAVGETMEPGREVPWQFWGGGVCCRFS